MLDRVGRSGKLGSALREEKSRETEEDLQGAGVEYTENIMPGETRCSDVV